MRIFLAILLGLLFGGIISKFLFVGSFLNLLPWGLVGLATGIYAKTKKEAIINGAVYGFVLSFIFMAVGYTGAAPLVTKFPFFALLGLFGAFCGAILGIAGMLIKKIFIKNKSISS